MKKITNTNGIRIALFATFLLFASLNLSAQYKLELEWQKKLVENIASITKSDNDSLIYVASANKIRTIRTSDGEVTNEIPVDAAYNLIMSRDGKTLIASGGWGVGLLDPQNYKRIYWDSVYLSDFRSLSYNEKQNMYLICGNSFNQPVYSFLKVYDAEQKKIIKEFSSGYFGVIRVNNASITDDGKYIIYSYETYTLNPTTQHFFVKMIDLDGKLVKDFGETSSCKFTTTNDGKTLIYFDKNAMHFFDLTSMKEVEGIPIGGANPYQIEMTNNGKFMLASNIFCDLINKKTMIFDEIGLSETVHFRLNSDNSSLFVGQARNLYKLKLFPTASIVKDVNQNEFTILVNNNKLILSNPQNHQIYTLTAYDILGRTYPLTANRNEVDVSALAAGRYFLKVGLGDGSFLYFGFVVEN